MGVAVGAMVWTPEGGAGATVLDWTEKAGALLAEGTGVVTTATVAVGRRVLGASVKLGIPVAMVVVALGAGVLVVKLIVGELLVPLEVEVGPRDIEGGALERSDGVTMLPSCGDTSRPLELAEVELPVSFTS